MAIGGSEALDIPRPSLLTHVIQNRIEKIMLSEASELGAQLDQNVLAERSTRPQAIDCHLLTVHGDSTGAHPNVKADFPPNITFYTTLVTGTGNRASARAGLGPVSRLHLFCRRRPVHDSRVERSDLKQSPTHTSPDARTRPTAFKARWRHAQAAKLYIVAWSDGPASP